MNKRLQHIKIRFPTKTKLGYISVPFVFGKLNRGKLPILVPVTNLRKLNIEVKK